MQEVCSDWKAVAQDVSLWKKLDMSRVKVTEFQLLRWVKSGMLKRVLELNLSHFGSELQHSTIVAIIQHCPRLELISVAHNPKITMETLKYIIDNCANLRGIDLSGITKNRGNSAFVPFVIKPLIEKHGSNLTQLVLSENALGSLTTVVNMVPVSYPYLDLARKYPYAADTDEVSQGGTKLIRISCLNFPICRRCYRNSKYWTCPTSN